jgi:hypothetical protein
MDSSIPPSAPARDDRRGIRSLLLVGLFKLIIVVDSVRPHSGVFRKAFSWWSAATRSVSTFGEFLPFRRRKKIELPRQGAIIVFQSSKPGRLTDRLSVSGITSFNAVVASEKYREMAGTVGASKTVSLSDFWTDAASDLAIHQAFALFRKLISESTAHITVAGSALSAMTEPFVYTRYILINRLQRALQVALEDEPEAVVIFGFNLDEIWNSYWPLIQSSASDAGNIWHFGASGKLVRIGNPKDKISSLAAEAWISKQRQQRDRSRGQDRARRQASVRRPTDLLVVSDAPARTPYWRAAFNVVQAAKRRRLPFQIAIFGNEAFFELLRHGHLARRFATRLRVVTTDDRRAIVAFLDQMNALMARGSHSLLDATVLYDLRRPAVAYWLLRYASLYRQMFEFIGGANVRAVLLLPHYSEFSVITKTIADQFGIKIAGGPAVTIAPSVSSIVGWEGIETILCYGEQCRSAFEFMEIPRERIHLVGNMVLPAVASKSVQECLSRVRRRFPGFPSDRRIVLVATSSIDPDETLWIARLAEHAYRLGFVTIVKSHPTFPIERYAKLAPLMERGVVFCTNKIEIYDLIPPAAVCVTDNSTVGAEAASLGKPLMVVNLTGKKFSANDYVADGMALGVTELNQIEATFDRLLFDAPTRERLDAAKLEFAKAYNWPNDFRAPDRILDLLTS